MKTFALVLSTVLVTAAALRAGATEPPVPFHPDLDAPLVMLADDGADAPPTAGRAAAGPGSTRGHPMRGSRFAGERRAAAMAAEGPEPLRRFIGRTQGIYPLRFQDYAPNR